jgi:hypothetical protein
MAGDWIKMRVGLTTNPRVMRLAECLIEDSDFLAWSGLSYGMAGYPPPSESDARSERHAALRVTRYVTVTALLRFWGYANEHVKGEFIAGILPEDVDEIVGVPGFARAIAAAEWVEFHPAGGLSMPNFAEHNTSVGERSSGAERQKRYREKQKSVTGSDAKKSDVTRDVTVTHREEKRREEKKEQEQPAIAVDLFAGIAPEVVRDFKALRKAKKAAITETAVDGIKREADKAGVTFEAALRICCERGWAGFKADWLTGQPSQPVPARKLKELK